MPIVTEERGGRFARIIQVLANEKEINLAGRLLQSFAFDPIAVMDELELLERAAKKCDNLSIKDLLRRLKAKECPPPPLRD